MKLLHYNTVWYIFPYFDPDCNQTAGKPWIKAEMEKNAQFMFPTYKPSNKNAGHLNLKMCPKYLRVPLPLIGRG